MEAQRRADHEIGEKLKATKAYKRAASELYEDAAKMAGEYASRVAPSEPSASTTPSFAEPQTESLTLAVRNGIYTGLVQARRPAQLSSEQIKGVPRQSLLLVVCGDTSRTPGEYTVRKVVRHEDSSCKTLRMVMGSRKIKEPVRNMRYDVGWVYLVDMKFVSDALNAMQNMALLQAPEPPPGDFSAPYMPHVGNVMPRAQNGSERGEPIVDEEAPRVIPPRFGGAGFHSMAPPERKLPERKLTKRQLKMLQNVDDQDFGDIELDMTMTEEDMIKARQQKPNEFGNIDDNQCLTIQPNQWLEPPVAQTQHEPLAQRVGKLDRRLDALGNRLSLDINTISNQHLQDVAQLNMQMHAIDPANLRDLSTELVGIRAQLSQLVMTVSLVKEQAADVFRLLCTSICPRRAPTLPLPVTTTAVATRGGRHTVAPLY